MTITPASLSESENLGGLNVDEIVSLVSAAGGTSLLSSSVRLLDQQLQPVEVPGAPTGDPNVLGQVQNAEISETTGAGDVPGTMRLQMVEIPDFEFNPYDHILRAYVSYFDKSGPGRTELLRIPVGTFRAIAPVRTISSGRILWDMTCYDMTWDVHKVEFENPYTVPRGASYTGAAKTILSMDHLEPSDGGRAGGGFSYPDYNPDSGYTGSGTYGAFNVGDLWHAWSTGDWSAYSPIEVDSAMQSASTLWGGGNSGGWDFNTVGLVAQGIAGPYPGLLGWGSRGTGTFIAYQPSSGRYYYNDGQGGQGWYIWNLPTGPFVLSGAQTGFPTASYTSLGSWPSQGAPGVTPQGLPCPGPDIPPSRINIPDMPQITPFAFPYDAGSDEDTAVNDLLKHVNCYPIFGDPYGVITSRKMPYYTKDPVIPIWTFTNDPDDPNGVIQGPAQQSLADQTQLFNLIEIRVEPTCAPPYNVVQKNTSPLSAISIPRLGKTWVKVFSGEKFATRADAELAAFLRLQQAAMQDESVTIQGALNPFIQPYEPVIITARGPGSHIRTGGEVTYEPGDFQIDGRVYPYVVRSYTFNLTQRTMTITAADHLVYI